MFGALLSNFFFTPPPSQGFSKGFFLAAVCVKRKKNCSDTFKIAAKIPFITKLLKACAHYATKCHLLAGVSDWFFFFFFPSCFKIYIQIFIKYCRILVLKMKNGYKLWLNAF